MAHLSIALLGTFQVTLDGSHATGFKSNKVRALLAYLAVEADRPHPRRVLAALLWPDWPDREALNNLRYALSNLRGVIGDRHAAPPFLLITRDTLQFNTDSDYQLDVADFTEALAAEATHPPGIDQLEHAVTLYRGSFLGGFSVGDSPPFEEWALMTREQLARQVSSALHQLAATHEQRRQYDQAQAYARRQIELEPWDEVAHQQLMRSLALSGQRSAALAQYEACSRLLADELGVDPGGATTALYEEIRDGLLGSPGLVVPRSPEPAPSAPRFLEEDVPGPAAPVFVARERELAQLDQFLDLALAGQGRVIFVTGEAGSGKTSLIQEFTRRAQEAYHNLLVAGGNCNAYTGIGDPYLPFRQILELLTGDVAPRWAAGAMTGDQARRLWNNLPLAARALCDHGKDLVGAFLALEPLLQRSLLHHATSQVRGTADWLTGVRDLSERGPVGLGASGALQIGIFEQYTRVLQALAEQTPLVLLVDDLQWADAGSISLLFHLGKQIEGSSILIVGAYRPEEVAGERDDERHPLDPVVNELRRSFGDVTVDVDQAEGRAFVEALLDSEPNQLGPSFREMLYRQTRGHPLFTVELLKGLQERGDLVPDPEGRWVESPDLQWEILPVRVEAAIAERIARLAQPLQTVLRVASVEGEDFTAEVVARVVADDQRAIVQSLSNELDRRHRLVSAQVIERVGANRVSRYRFRNYLVQRYLYDEMDQIERALLHEDVGFALEELLGDQPGAATALAPQLAWHFREAGLAEKAIPYLIQAGERAIQLSAYQEAVAHLTKGLGLLGALPDSEGEQESRQRTRQEQCLQLARGIALTGLEGYSLAAERAYNRAGELCRELGDTAQLSRVTAELSCRQYVLAEHLRARELAAEALRLAKQVEHPLLVSLAQWSLGFVLFALGEFGAARAHLRDVIASYEPTAHHQAFVLLRGSDAGLGALAYDACCLWCLGYPEQASKRSREALALARELEHPFSLADVLCFGGCLINEFRGDSRAFHDFAEELLELATDKVSGWFGTASRLRGQALAELGYLEDGIAQMRIGLLDDRPGAERCFQSGTLGRLAVALAETGRLEDGLSTLEAALSFVRETGERYYEPELHRLRGGLLLEEGREDAAEASFLKAIEVARSQSARSWELRATVSLCRLWQQQGRREAARKRLAEIYDWFTEGFDTPDLIEAKALLDALSS